MRIESRSPEIQQLFVSYEKARKRLDTDIKKHLNFRYDLPAKTPEKDDPDYNRYMYRNAAINVLLGQVSMLMNMDARGFVNQDPETMEIASEVNGLTERLKEIAMQPDTETIDPSLPEGIIPILPRTESDMKEIREIVERLVLLCEKFVEANNPASVEAAA